MLLLRAVWEFGKWLSGSEVHLRTHVKEVFLYLLQVRLGNELDVAVLLYFLVAEAVQNV